MKRLRADETASQVKGSARLSVTSGSYAGEGEELGEVEGEERRRK